MYLNLGQSAVLPTKDIVGIFDMDNATWAHRTRKFLERTQREGKVIALGDDLPRSFVLCRDGRVYTSQFSAGALKGRVIL